MNVKQAGLPGLTGDIYTDMTNLHEYAQRLEDILSFMLSNLNRKNFNSNLLPELFESDRLKFGDIEIRRFENGLWIGSKTESRKNYSPAKGEYGLLVSPDAAPKKILDGAATDI